MIAATYFDGQTTRRHPVTLMMHRGVVAISGDGVRRSMKLSRMQVSERLEHAPRILRFPDGGFIEVDYRNLPRLLAKNGYRDSWVVRWQQQWAWSLCALIAVIALLISAYQWGVPWAVDQAASRMPASMEKKIGDEELRLIDASYMEPSRLDPAEQARLHALFAGLKRPQAATTPYRLEFRHSRVGPNAFALPNGVIIMTDQLVGMAPDDNAVLAVLAHELGHVQGRHSLRRLLQALGVGVAVNLIIGDVSSILAAVPTFLLDQKYSRDFEREADQFAIAMMQANGLPLSPMAELFERMGNAHRHEERNRERNDGTGQDSRGGRRTGSDSDSPLAYLSSHPSDKERIAALRAADAKLGKQADR
ncbi:M48 family metallopeptidase [Noviherbaspirillum sp.]|uniref:M48 family metallopeptidase n=1 Tax=Noviherbaspirillum sp. TaxID=1926288 RepID=UPI002FE1EF8D